ncbi:MAG: hypothetical protein ACJ797_21770 [Ktedonobacteraceae bacterium]
MIIIDEERASDSPFVERIWRSHSEGVNPFLSIAVNHCEFVVSRLQGKVTMTLRGPETKATPIGNAPAAGQPQSDVAVLEERPVPNRRK